MAFSAGAWAMSLSTASAGASRLMKSTTRLTASTRGVGRDAGGGGDARDQILHFSLLVGRELGDCQDFMSPLRASKSSAGVVSRAIGRISLRAFASGWTVARQEQESAAKTSPAPMPIKSIFLIY